jgi:hypothetical protein
VTGKGFGNDARVKLETAPTNDASERGNKEEGDGEASPREDRVNAESRRSVVKGGPVDNVVEAGEAGVAPPDDAGWSGVVTGQYPGLGEGEEASDAGDVEGSVEYINMWLVGARRGGSTMGRERPSTTLRSAFSRMSCLSSSDKCSVGKLHLYKSPHTTIMQ